MTTPTGTPSGLEHVGMLYHDREEYVRGCARFARRGLGAGEPVMVAVPGANGRLIREELGVAADSVRFADMTSAGRNPAGILPWVLLDFAKRHAGQRVWIIGEPVWPGRTPMEYPACVAHEALINKAFAGYDAAILCPYDAANLGAEVIDDSWRTHPVMADAVRTWLSTAYDDPVGVVARLNRPLPQPPPQAERHRYMSVSELTRLRGAVARQAELVGLTPHRVADLLVAINELASNTIDHTPTGEGALTVWQEPGVLVCQVEDYGRFTDPMAGRVPPANPFGRGHGLTLVSYLTDLLRIYTHHDGTTFRLHMHTDE